jgi:SIR2-like domain
MSLPKQSLLDLILKALDKEVCTFVIGSGLSLSAGMPSSAAIVSRIKSESAFAIVSTELPRVAEEYSAVYGRASLNQLLVTIFSECKPIYPNIYDQICLLPMKEILTTNWDILLEESLRRVRRPYFPVRIDPDVEGVHRSVISYIKLHGCITTPSSMIVTESDYDAYLSTHHHMCQLFQERVMRNVIVFLGYSLRDDTFRRLLKIQLNELQRPHHPIILVDPEDSIGYEAVLASNNLFHLREAGEDFIEKLWIDPGISLKRYRGIQDRWDYRIPAPPQDLLCREDIHEKIREKISACFSSSTWPLIVTGPSGIGKTSIVRATADRLSNHGITPIILDGRTLKDDVTFAKVVAINKEDGFPKIARGKTLIIVDHFEAMLSESSLTSMLSQFCDRCGPSVGFVLVIRSEECMIRPLEANYSELAKLLAVDLCRIEIRELDEEEVATFIDIFEDDFGSPIDDKMRRFIAQFTAGHPWLLKKVLYLFLERPDLLRNLSSAHQLFFYDLERFSEFDIQILRELAKSPGVNLNQLSNTLGRDVKAWVTRLISERLVISRQAGLFVYHDLFADFLRKSPSLEVTSAVSIALAPFFDGIRQMREAGDWEAVYELYKRILPVAAEKRESAAELLEDIAGTANLMVLSSEIFMFPSLFSLLVSVVERNPHLRGQMTSHANRWHIEWRARKEHVLASTLKYFEPMQEDYACQTDDLIIGKGLIWLLRSHDRRTGWGKPFVAWGDRAGFNAHETCQVLSLLCELLNRSARRSDSWLRSGRGYLKSPLSQSHGRRYVWPYPIGLSREKPSPYTTAWCLEALAELDYRTQSNNFLKALEWLAEVQNGDGGWPRPGTSESHVRETAIILQVLRRLLPYMTGTVVDIDRCIREGDSFILSSQESSGAFVISSIERTESIFATSYAASYLGTAVQQNEEYRKPCLEALRWLSDCFTEESGWIGKEPSFGQIEAAGIFLSTLCRVGIRSLASPHALKRYIVRNQRNDGSWPLFDQRERSSWGMIHPTVIALRSLIDYQRMPFARNSTSSMHVP